MSIYDYLRNYKADRYHTPGHKGELDELDITELEDMFPIDRIEQAERTTAGIYKAEHLKYLVNGSSIGMKAGICAVRTDIICEHYRHRAVDEGAELIAKQVYVLPSTTVMQDDGMYALPTADDIEKAFCESSAKLVLIQYPDYYGRCCDIASIKKVCEKYDKFLYVDSAHGAHFICNDKLLPMSGTLLADACNLSAHKTLNAYTQTAYLAYSQKMKDAGIERALTCLSTTSPNYMFLAQLEVALVEGVSRSGEYARLKAFCDKVSACVPVLKTDDFTKLSIDCGNLGGKLVYDMLVKEQIVAEKYDDRYVLLLLTIYDSNEKLDRLFVALNKIINGELR